MKKALLSTLLLAALHSIGNAQSISPFVISNAGDFYSNASGSVSWTLGEPMGETYAQTNNIVTQGFQQPWDFGTAVTGQVPVNAEVYPNPTADIVNLQFGAGSNGTYVIEVYNTLGQSLSTTELVVSGATQTSVSLRDEADGIYFITIRKTDGTAASTFRINKHA